MAFSDQGLFTPVQRQSSQSPLGRWEARTQVSLLRLRQGSWRRRVRPPVPGCEERRHEESFPRCGIQALGGMF